MLVKTRLNTGHQKLYDNIASGAIANWDIQNISQQYTHLEAILTARGSNASNAIVANLRLNNDSGSVYSYETLQAVAATSAGTENFSQTSFRAGQCAAASATTNYIGSIRIFLPNYRDTTFYKAIQCVCQNNVNVSTNGVTEENEFGQYSSLTAISRITITPSAGNFIAGSRLTIYGIR